MSEDRQNAEERWSAYYRKVADRPVNAFFGRALMRVERPGFAIDLG